MSLLLSRSRQLQMTCTSPGSRKWLCTSSPALTPSPQPDAGAVAPISAAAVNYAAFHPQLLVPLSWRTGFCSSGCCEAMHAANHKHQHLPLVFCVLCAFFLFSEILLLFLIEVFTYLQIFGIYCLIALLFTCVACISQNSTFSFSFCHCMAQHIWVSE